MMSAASHPVNGIPVWPAVPMVRYHAYPHMGLLIFTCLSSHISPLFASLLSTHKCHKCAALLGGLLPCFPRVRGPGGPLAAVCGCPGHVGDSCLVSVSFFTLVGHPVYIFILLDFYDAFSMTKVLLKMACHHSLLILPTTLSGRLAESQWLKLPSGVGGI